MANVTALRVNGKKLQVDADPERSLLSVLREDLDLTGSKYGCGEGQCGACTVLLDDVPTRSCVTPVGVAAAMSITTIEGVEENGRLHPLQQAFIDADAMQCAYCTAGMIMTGVGLLRKKPHPTEEEIRHAMEGNVCRCCTYPRILSAFKKVARNGNGKAAGGAR
jgi:aerobic-type carbon monoxide dehydrogenase small subunit (CoxS/CutS family)